MSSMDAAADESILKKPFAKRPLPVWARIIVALVLTAIVSLTYGAFRLADWIGIMARDAIDAKKMPVVAAEIGAFPQPLPDGYKYEYAYDLPVPFVQIHHDSDNQLIQVMLILLDGSIVEDDPELFINRAIDSGGIPMPTQMPNKIHAIKLKGKQIIAGHRMPYIVGEFYDEKGRNVEGMIGCICIKEKRKTILIYALEPFGTPYNLQVTMDLLKSIKSF
jgi:hypothetical protein